MHRFLSVSFNFFPPIPCTNHLQLKFRTSQVIANYLIRVINIFVWIFSKTPFIFLPCKEKYWQESLLCLKQLIFSRILWCWPLVGMRLTRSEVDKNTILLLTGYHFKSILIPQVTDNI